MTGMCIMCARASERLLAAGLQKHRPVPPRKLMKENSPGRQSRHNSGGFCFSLVVEMERSRHWERREAAPDLQCKGRDGDGVGVGAQLGCSGALLPSSFGRVADLRASKRSFHPGWMKAGHRVQFFYFFLVFFLLCTPTSLPDFYDFE